MNNTTIQANNLNILFKVWVTYSNEEWFTNKDTANTIGYVSRQGQYYNQALQSLGVADFRKTSRSGEYKIKEEFYVYNVEEAKEKFKKIATIKFLEKEEKRIDKESSEDVIKRRRSAIKAWKKFVETNEIPEIRRNHKPKSFELGKAKKESSKEEEFKPPKESKKSTISTNTNKGYNHTLMMNAIGAYARTHEIQLRKENSHADLTSFNEEEQTFKIIEIKSYPALYLAIGQLLHYEHKFKKVIHTAENLEYKKIYVGVETLDSIQEGLLEQLNIKYVKYDKQKLDEIFN